MQGGVGGEDRDVEKTELTLTKDSGRPSKKKNYEISDICQISVTLPTLYPDMDIKKFRHIFYTLTYLPIRKIWTKLEKSWYFYKIFRLFKNFTDPFIVSVTTSSAHSFSIVDL